MKRPVFRVFINGRHVMTLFDEKAVWDHIGPFVVYEVKDEKNRGYPQFLPF